MTWIPPGPDTSANNSMSGTSKVTDMLLRKSGPGYTAHIMVIYATKAATRLPKKDSNRRQVIMDCSWSHLSKIRINACTLKDT